MRATATFLSRGAMCAVFASLPLTSPTFAQKGDDESAKYPPKALNERDARRAEVEDAYRQMRSEGIAERVIYGSDDRRDWYEILPGESVIQSLEQAVCVVVSTSEVTNNGNGTYTLSTVNWTTVGGSPVCSNEPFFNQRTIGFCSGFLVGNDLIATAGHCVDSFDCGSTAFVFGFDQQSASVGPDIVVPADNVYFCSGIVDQVQAGDLDHSVVQVDRDVVGRTPVPIRRSGVVSNGDPLVMIGHPVTLPKKVDDGAVVKNANGSTAWFNANLDAYGGNSGSMVANLATGVVEGILVRGNTDFTSSGGCLVSNQCADSGCPDWEEVSKTISFAASVPDLGLAVMPAAGTTHVGLVGGPFSDAVVTYTLNNPTGSAIDYTVSLVGGGTAPLLLDGGASDVTGTITAGGSTTVDVSLEASANGFAAGVYTTDVDFSDDTNGRVLTRTHVLEIGQTGFTVTPASDLVGSGPVGGPFTGTVDYRVESTRPTPVQVTVGASDSWLTIDGAASATFTLTGAGDSQTVTATIGSDADTLSAGLYTTRIDFTNDTGGAGDTSRIATLDVGRYVYPAGDVPQNINDNSTITSNMTVGDAICVGDVDVDIDITHSYIGDLIVELQSPEGTVVRLHNRTGSSTDNIVARYNDSSNPPDGPGVLADFNDEIVSGVWTLTVSDNAGQDTGTLNDWSLRIASTAGGGCPPIALDVDAQVPHTVTSSITLSGSSTNGPFDSIIMSLPSDGTLSDPLGVPIGAAPYTLLAGGDTVNYTPAPGFVGADSFTYKINDGLDSNVADVSVTVGLPEVVFDFPLDSDPGWTTEGLWAFGQPTGGGSHNFDPSSGFSGVNVYGYNLSGDYTSDMPRYALTTPALDFGNVTQATLEFRRWLGIESSTFDHASIELSTDGASWDVIWNHSTGSLSEASWSLQSFDISALADNQATVYIRWIMGTTDGSVTYPGWNIDDIQIIGIAPPALCDGDVNGDLVVDLTDLAVLLSNFDATGASRSDGDLNGDTVVDLEDLALLLSTFGVPC